MSTTNEKYDEEGTMEGRNEEEREINCDKQTNKRNKETLDNKQNCHHDGKKEDKKQKQ